MHRAADLVVTSNGFGTVLGDLFALYECLGDRFACLLSYLGHSWAAKRRQGAPETDLVMICNGFGVAFGDLSALF